MILRSNEKISYILNKLCILYSCVWFSLFGAVNLIELNWPAMRPGGWKCSGVLYARRWVMRQTRTLL